MHTLIEAQQYSIDVLARLQKRVKRAGVEPGDTFLLDAGSVPVARVMRLTRECGIDYLDLLSRD